MSCVWPQLSKYLRNEPYVEKLLQHLILRLLVKLEAREKSSSTQAQACSYNENESSLILSLEFV